MATSCPRCTAAVPADARYCMKCGAALSSDAGMLAPAAEADRLERMALHAPASLVAKMRTARLTGERKRVTALFADVVGSTAMAERMDPEEWTALINTAFELMSQAVYRYEGTVAQLQGDALVCFYGAPIAHEDDPLRAVAAALEMVDVIDDFAAQLRLSTGIDFRIRAGINTGLVVVGNIGSNLSLEYTAVGDTMNVAARLQAAAEPGTVLITEATYKLVASAIEVVDLGPLSLKGKEAPVLAYRVVRRRPIPGRARGIEGLYSPMVGRDAQLERLAGAYRTLADGGARLVLLTGEPGIGKSRLLEEFRQQLVLPGGRWVEGRCLSYGRGLPYHLVRDVVRSIADIHAGADDGATRAALASWLVGARADGLGESADYLAHLLFLPLEPGQQADIERLEPEVLQARYADALGRALLGAASERPLVVVCEDVHWADASSVELLRRLLASIARSALLLLLSLRPDRESEGWRLLEAARETVPSGLLELELQPLNEAESRSLVAFLLEIESLPAELRQRILDRAEGNPFFVEELVRMLIERGLLVRQGERWSAASGVELIEIPETIHGLLLARIDRLAEQPKRALRVASVIGRQFSAQVLGEALAADDGNGARVGPAEELLEPLVEAGLIDLATDGVLPEFVFHHALIQEAAYNSLLHRERAGLHRAVAQALQRVHDDVLDDLAPELARHYGEAGDLAAAAEWAFRGARHFEQRSALVEARALYDRAVEWLPAGERNLRRRVEIIVGQGRTGLYMHSAEDESERLASVVDDAEGLGDVHLAVELYTALAFGLQLRGEQYATSPRLQRAIDRAIELGEGLGADPIRAQPMMVKGLALFFSGRLRASVELLGPAVDLLEASGNLLFAFEAEATRNMALVRLGRFAEAEKAVARMTVLAQRSGYPSAALDLQSGIALLAAERGELEHALSAAQTAATGGEAEGILTCAGFGHMIAGDISLRQGDVESAVRALRRSRQLAQRSGADFIVAMGSAADSAASWSAGNRQAALAGWAAALEVAREAGDPFTEAEILARRGGALAEAATDASGGSAGNELAPAIADLEAAVAIFTDIGARPALARAQLSLSAAYRAAGRMGEAQRSEEAGRGLLAELGLADRAAAGA